MKFISYAQNFEDVILWRALKHIVNGTYVDIGAQDPEIDSVSLAFYKRGWRGVHVQPAPEYTGKLRSARPDEAVIGALVGARESEHTLYEFASTGLSTGSRSIAESHLAEGREAREVEVPTIPLSQVLDRFNDREIHWLKIDVEGMEKEVLESWAPSPKRPWIVVVESTEPGSPVTNFDRWEASLLALGYQFAYFDGLNRFYVSDAHRELKETFGPGPNVFDGFELSGQANAPFCRGLTAEIESLRTELAGHSDQIAKTHAEFEATRTRSEAEATRFEAERTRFEAERARSEAEATRFGAERTRFAAERTRFEMEIRAKDHALAHEIAHWSNLARDASAHVEAMRNSTSWRVSAPVRWAGSSVHAAAVALKSAGRPALERCLEFVRRHPWTKGPILAAARLIPPVRRKLIRFGQMRGEPLTAADVIRRTQTPASFGQTRKPLTPRARQIYADLNN